MIPRTSLSAERIASQLRERQRLQRAGALGWGLGTLLLLAPTWTQTEGADPPFPVRPLTASFQLIEGGNGAGANVGVLVGAEGVVLFDAMKDESHERLLRTVREITAGPITHVFNTHGDSDHSGGNERLVALGATIVAQENVRYRSPRAYPIETFTQRLEVELYGETITLIAQRSHSPDDALIHLERNNVILLGDTYTNVWHPTFYSGGHQGQLAVLELALDLADEETVIVPGHGRPAHRADLLDYRKRCIRWHERVRALVEVGTTEEAMLRDAELQTLRAEFNLRHAERPISDTSFERFLSRTLATDFVDLVPLRGPSIEAYLGQYRYEDGIDLRLTLEGGRIVARQWESGFYELLPVARDRFRIRGSLDPERYVTFEIDPKGLVTAATYVTAESRYRAPRVEP